MNKKFFICSFLVSVISIFAADMMRKEQNLRMQTRLMQQGYSKKDIAKQAAKGAVLGATVLPATIGIGVMAHEDPSLYNVAVGPIAGVTTVWGKGLMPAFAGIGAALNVARNYALIMWQVKKISKILLQYTKLKFESLPEDYAMILVAAYRRNIPLLKSLIELHSDFMCQKGIWIVVTELFFNKKPTNTRVKEFQKMIMENVS